MVSAPAYDFPDWNRPATRLAAASVATLPFHMLAHDEFAEGVANNLLNDVMLVAGLVPNGVAVRVSSTDGTLLGQAFGLTAIAVQSFHYMEIPLQHRGLGMTVEGLNTNSTTQDMTLQFVSFSGANVDTMMTEAVLTQTNIGNVAAGGTSPFVAVDQAFLYDRMTLCVHGADAFEVTVRRRFVFGVGVLSRQDMDEVVTTSGAAGSKIIDIPLGAPGVAISVKNTSGGTAAYQWSARCYRPLGS